MAANQDVTSALGDAGANLFTANDALSRFMADLYARANAGAPAVAGQDPKTSALAAAVTTAPSGGLMLDLGKLSTRDWGNLTERDWAVVTLTLASSLKPSTPLAGEAFGCAGCEFFGALQ